jgi:hypothetical protein
MDVLLFLATKNQQEASFSSLSPSRMETREGLEPVNLKKRSMMEAIFTV